MDFFSRSRYCNKNYGYPSTSDEGYFFSGTVDNYEFYPLEITIPENFIEFRGFFRDWQSVDCVILFFLPAHLYRICIMSNLMEHDKEFLSVRVILYIHAPVHIYGVTYCSTTTTLDVVVAYNTSGPWNLMLSGHANY